MIEKKYEALVATEFDAKQREAGRGEATLYSRSANHFDYTSGTGSGGSDFSPETIEQRAEEGYKQTEAALLA